MESKGRKKKKGYSRKREKLSGHKKVGEFFDTCILRVRFSTRTLYLVILSL